MKTDCSQAGTDPDDSGDIPGNIDIYMEFPATCFPSRKSLTTMSGKIRLVIISAAAQVQVISPEIRCLRIRLPVISTLDQALLVLMPAQAMVYRSSILMGTVVTTTRTPSRIPAEELIPTTIWVPTSIFLFAKEALMKTGMLMGAIW